MPGTRERAVLRAVASMPLGADLTVIDGRTGRAAAHRPGGGPEPEAALLVVGPIDLRGGRYAVRPNRRDGSVGGDPDDLAILSAPDRRRVRRERNRRLHATRTNASPGATSAPQGAPEADARPGASAERPEAPTRPEVRAI